MVLLSSLTLPLQAAIAFLSQGCLAVFGGQLLGFPLMGIEPSIGTAAMRTGAILILLGILCALVALMGIRYSIREIRKFDKGNS